MELLFVIIIGAAIGAVLRYTLPGRRWYGSVLLPALGAAISSAVWAGLVWLGWTFDGTWIWVVSLSAGGTAALVAALVLPRRRTEADARLLTQLSGGKA